MATKLKLHNPSNDQSGTADNAPPRMVLKFPTDAEARTNDGRWSGPRLVGEENDAAAHAVIDAEDMALRPISSADLVRQIESTLDRMQNRLDRFRRQMDDTFKFPEPSDDDDRPFAA